MCSFEQQCSPFYAALLALCLSVFNLSGFGPFPSLIKPECFFYCGQVKRASLDQLNIITRVQVGSVDSLFESEEAEEL